MTDIEKNLLKNDLCCRLPYNVKVHAKYTNLGETIEVDGIVKMVDTDGFVGIEVMYDTSSSYICVDIDNVKPYLFPLDSMTEEQKEEWKSLLIREAFDTSDNVFTPQDFYCKYHLDYRGLIKKNLANNINGFKTNSLFKDLITNCKPIEGEFSKFVDDNFYDLI